MLAAGCASQTGSTQGPVPTPVEQPPLAGPSTQPTFRQQLGQTGEAFVQLWENLTGNTPLRAVQMMEDPYFPDERRQGITRLSARAWGRREPYTTRYAQIAQFDANHLVRAAAVRALNRSRDASQTDLFIRRLSDESYLVRLEAAKALSNIPDQAAIPGLLKVVQNESEHPDVRIAAADALRHYRTLQVGRVLISLLSSRNFGIAWQANQSLQVITGRNFKYDQSAWLEYVTSAETPFS
jgi:hypothetical protein